ncbi:MAG TPA: hypothetical protein VJ731_18265 [Terriglobales bacterium]|nr:hypothetical protein [Terriglobales bacterium]
MSETPVNSGHEYFEELCALAALGELSAVEMAVLRSHLESCVSCSLEQEHYVRILRSQLPLTDVHRALLPIESQFECKGYRERFLARARMQGFTFTPHVEQRFTSRWPLLECRWWRFLALAAALLVLGGAVLLVQLRYVPQTSATGQRDSRALRQPTPHVLSTPSFVGSTDRVATPSVFQPLLSDQSLARERQLERQLTQARAGISRLQSSVQLSTARVEELSTELQESRSRLEETTAELRRLDAQHASDNAIISAEESSIAELKDHISSQSDALEREERLLALDRDIRNVMTARSLHIIDVYDVDSRGNLRKPFGRAFYTDHKSLIFYAYDMPKTQLRNAHSFQAWGYKEPSRQDAQSLGIFYVDDKAQNRWVLRVDDPAVLAQIDAVFVTIEPAGGSGKPTGKRLMYAYLNGAPNHP